MKFVDEVSIYVEAGNGGNGCCSFRHEKYVPRGGPDGGDGGRGGDVYLVADTGASTLLDLRYNQHQRGKRGSHGKGKQMTGAAGQDRLVRVPEGTIAYDVETGELIGEVLKQGQRLLLAHGGRGGRGNMRFLSSKNQAPRRADPGEPGEVRQVRLELKLLADVGLVGFPNVGKSTLISACSKARPKIADYPFTTIIPNLGVVQADSGNSFVMADIPGLIEGAADGAGMGIRFLRHVERCSVLLHVLEFNEERGGEPLADYEALCSELKQYAPEMLDKPQIVCLNKTDLSPDSEAVEDLRSAFNKLDIPFFTISAATRKGLKKLLNQLDQLIKRPEPELTPFEEFAPTPCSEVTWSSEEEDE